MSCAAAGDVSRSLRAVARLHDLPDAAELTDVTAAFLREEVLPTVADELRWELLITLNLLAVVGRELRAPQLEEEHMRRLAALGCHDDAELAARIRSGELDERADEVRAAVLHSVLAKLEIARPGWAERRRI
jgi:hypothetical protein